MVAEGGYSPGLLKAQNEQRTIEATVDISQGGIYPQFIYQFKVYETLPGGVASDYGTIHDLEYFFSLNNPNGTPSDVITMTDHFGDLHDVIMMGNLIPQPLSVIISGDNALYFYKVEFHEIEYQGYSY
jgi:hypothetical protein